MSSASLLKTACHEWHVANNGRMVDFAGWDMPVQYSSIVEEHQAVRNAVGLFDIAHMGRLWFSGPDAQALLNHILTIDCSRLKIGQVKYCFVTNEQGGILDDVLLYRLEERFLLVVNASNRLKVVDWIKQHQGDRQVDFQDKTTKQFMCAVQGPKALEILQPYTQCDLETLQYYYITETELFGLNVYLSRTGYTGEDGFEIIVPVEQGVEVWQKVMEAGEAAGIQPAGLGCRDTLRLEAAMPLYGHELNESIDPLTAGLRFGVQLKGTSFLSHAALVEISNNPSPVKRVGLELEGRRIAREGATLHLEDEQVGEVTSGTFSPTLQKSISMGYVQANLAVPGTKLEVDLRGKKLPAVVVPLPFYKRTKS